MKFYIAFLVVLFSINIAIAQQSADSKNDRVLVVLDGSISMAQDWGKNNSRYDIASDIITNIIAQVYKINTDVEFGLWVYGHQFRPTANHCNDARREVFFSKDNQAQMALRLKDIKPRGKGSVENALREAIKSDIIDTHLYRYSIIVITDSSNTCPDNICIPLNQLGKTGNIYRRYLVDMTGKAINQPRYSCFDKAFPATNDYGIDTCIAQVVRNFKKKSIKYTKIVYESKPKKSNEVVIPVSPKPAMSVKKTIDTGIVKKPDTVLQQPKLKEEAVQIRKQSKIKSEIDEFGYLHLINTSIVARIIIMRLQNGTYEQTNEIYPVGMREVKVKLKTGSYKMLFNVSGLAEGTRTFEIINDTAAEIWFR